MLQSNFATILYLLVCGLGFYLIAVIISALGSIVEHLIRKKWWPRTYEKSLCFTCLMWLIWPPAFFKRFTYQKWLRYLLTLISPLTLTVIVLLIEGGCWVTGNKWPVSHLIVRDYVDDVEPNLPAFTIKNVTYNDYAFPDYRETCWIKFKEPLSGKFLDTLTESNGWNDFSADGIAGYVKSEGFGKHEFPNYVITIYVVPSNDFGWVEYQSF